jgi:hypothetical protein|tara:strand:- start:1344 stop:1571 length:228 start_codon:yes stop_codon:yes gene_type:complete
MADRPTFEETNRFWVNLKYWLDITPTKYKASDFEEWLDDYFKAPKETEEELQKYIDEENEECSPLNDLEEIVNDR